MAFRERHSTLFGSSTWQGVALKEIERDFRQVRDLPHIGRQSREISCGQFLQKHLAWNLSNSSEGAPDEKARSHSHKPHIALW